MPPNVQDPSSAIDETLHDAGGPLLNSDSSLPCDPSDDADLSSTMPSNVQDPPSAIDELFRDLGGPLVNSHVSLPCDPSDDVDFNEWLQDPEKYGNLDTTSSIFPVETSLPLGALDGSLDASSSFPVQMSAPQGALDGNLDTTSSFPVQMSAPQGALDVVDKHAPSTPASFSFGPPFIYNRKVLSNQNSSPPSAQDTESPVTLNAASASSPTSLGPSTPQKRKRSDKEEADSPLTPKTPRKRQARNPSWHHFSQPGSPSMIVDGQPCFVAQAPAPARGVKATVAAEGSSKSSNSERYLDSNRMRQMIKKGLAETEGIREGDKWECRLPGGTYLIECLGGGLCSMQWFGEVVFV